MRAISLGIWAFHRRRAIILGLHVAALASFGLVAILAAFALPGGVASFLLGVGIVGALFLLLRLPATLMLTRRVNRAQRLGDAIDVRPHVDDLGPRHVPVGKGSGVSRRTHRPEPPSDLG